MVVVMLNRWFFQKRTRYIRLFFVMMMVSLLLNGCGQQKPKIFRVGILCGLDVFIPTIEGFKKKMNEFGYVVKWRSYRNQDTRPFRMCRNRRLLPFIPPPLIWRHFQDY